MSFLIGLFFFIITLPVMIALVIQALPVLIPILIVLYLLRKVICVGFCLFDLLTAPAAPIIRIFIH